MARRPAPSPLLELAGLGAGALDLVLALLILAAFVDRAAPPQDLPWKPLSLGHPIGLATAFKLDRLAASPALCRAFLERSGLDLEPAASPARQGPCAVSSPVRLRDGLSPAAPLMDCPLAAAYAVWARQGVQPAAERWLGTTVAAVEHAGTYACRGVRAQTLASLEANPSQHARAGAIDVAGFRLADGRTVAVGRDWGDAAARGRFLAEARDSACRVMHATLSPDYNAAHAAHLHLDVGPYRLCG